MSAQANGDATTLSIRGILTGGEIMRMRLYLIVSGVFFSIICVLQTLRALSGWMVQLNGRTIPVWPSWIAAVVTGLFAFWAFRSLRECHKDNPNG